MNRTYSFPLLLQRQSDETTLQIFWNPHSTSILGRVFRNGRNTPAVLSGLPKRTATSTELPAVKNFLNRAAIHIQRNQISIWPRLLGGMANDSLPTITNESLSNILEGAAGRRDPANRQTYLAELDRRLTMYEEWTKTGTSDELCLSRNNLLLIAEQSSDDPAVFTRAMNGLIQALEEDPCDESTAENLQKIQNALRTKIAEFKGGSIPNLEKCTRGFGLALRGLVICYRAGFATWFLEENRIQIYQNAEKVARMVQSDDFAIQYNSDFIIEGVKYLKEESREKIIAQKAGKSAWQVLKTCARPFSSSIGVCDIAPTVGGSANFDALCENFETMWNQFDKLSKNNDWRKEKLWYKAVLILKESEKFVVENRENYDRFIHTFEGKEKNAPWQWYYAKINFLQNVIKNTKNERIRRKAIDAFSLCCKNEDLWENKAYDNIRIHLLLVFLDLLRLDATGERVYKKCIEGRENPAWHYAKIEFLRNVIQHSENKYITNKAINKLLSYENENEWTKYKRQIKLDDFRKNYYETIIALNGLNESKRIQKLAARLRENLKPKLKERKDSYQKKREKLDSVIADKDKAERTYYEYWNKIKRQKIEPKKTYEFKQPVASFIGREEILNEIKASLPSVSNEKTKVLVLSGLGGVGKTQLSRKFISENFTTYNMVYTLTGESDVLLNEDYRELAHKLKVDVTEASPIEIRKRVKERLEETANWLLLFDNVDDLKILNSLHSQLPERGGCVVITSREAVHWTGVRVMEVKEFELPDSIKLLKSIIPEGKRGETGTISALAEALGNLPLALVQAGAFIKSTKKKGYTASDYLTSFNKSYANSCHQFTLFKNEMKTDYRNRMTVTTTCNESRERIKGVFPLADKVLCLLAYFNTKNIPSEWIEQWLENRGIKTEESQYITEIIDMLSQDYSMIRYNITQLHCAFSRVFGLWAALIKELREF